MARLRRRSTASLAGWLFADLSLVLAIAFLATSGNDFTCRDPKTGKPLRECPAPVTTIPEVTTTTVSIGDVKGNGGVKPDPIEVVIYRGSNLSRDTLRRKLDEAISEQFKLHDDLAILGDASLVRFGVIIVRGGNKGETAGRVGSDNALRAESKLEWPKEPDKGVGWDKILPTTYFDTGHNTEYPPGALQFKLFPILPTDTK